MTEWTQLSYTPGRWVAVAAAEQWLLVDLAAEDPVVRRCWKLLSERAGVDAVLDALVSPGVALTPGFVLVSLSEEERRVVARYPASASVHSRGEDNEIAGVEGASWVDLLLGDEAPDGVTLRGMTSSGASSVELPMGSGVTTAGTVRVAAGVTAPAAPVTRAAPAVASADAAASVPEQATAPPPTPPQSSPARPKPPSGTGSPSPVGAPDAESQDGEAQSYDFLFGATTRPEDLTAAAEPVEPEVAAPDESRREAPPTPISFTATLVPTETAVPPPAPPPSPNIADGLIDAVPWLVGKDPAPHAAPSNPSPTGPAPSADVHDDQPSEPEPVTTEFSATINRAQLRAAAEAAATPGIKVLAGYCPSRHVSPPHAARCRVCSAPMPQQEPFEIVRPPLGVLRLATGEVITLDRGVVLGRSPEVSSAANGERPHVVRVSSPENDVSRTHAEIFLDGWNVYVRDFGSVNGTVVNLPGQPPQRLRDNDPHLLENGTVITLADEFGMTYEVNA